MIMLPVNKSDSLYLSVILLITLTVGMAKAQQPSLSAPEKPASNSASANALLAQGKALATAGDLPGAERALKTYLQQHERSAPALYLLGYVLQRENKPKESLTVFTNAAAIQAPQANDLRIVALDYVLIDDYPDAIHWLALAVQLDPLNAEAWYDLGRSQMNQGNFVAAQQAFEHVLAIAPRDVRALNNLGLSYEAQNRPSEALHAYAHAIAAQQGVPHPSEQPLLNYGNLLISQNRSAEAVATLESAIQISPRDPKCREALARAYLQAEQLLQAKQQFEQAVVLDPKNPRLHYQLGRLYRRLGLAAKAKTELALSEKLYGTRSTPVTK
ncbi:tetratricopeptide repeat protein [Edaphobacter paludis]|uniref:Tetratricopeptide repeat protein n=1 Tax=Edaphobacter paludis TaxID=3035702 RepID=A0AAU7D8A8_9BACT